MNRAEITANWRDIVMVETLAVLAGGLMGYGYYGTLQMACLGAGIGLVTIPAVIIIIILFS